MPLLSLCLSQARHSDTVMTKAYHISTVPIPLLLLMTFDPSRIPLSLLLSSESMVSASLDSSPLIMALSAVLTQTQWLLTIITKPVSLLYAFDFSLQWLDYAPARNFMNYRGWLGVDLQDLWQDGMSYSPFVSVVLAHDLWPWLLCGLAKLKCRGDLFLAGLWNPWVFNPFPTHFSELFAPFCFLIINWL